MYFITQSALNFIKKFLQLCLSLSLLSFAGPGCSANSASAFKDLDFAQLELPSGALIKVYIARSPDEQKKGLSSIASHEFKDNEAMLFPATKMQWRQFWMPDTHFDIDVIFLSKDFYVLDIHRSLPKTQKGTPKRLIPKSKTVYSQHVLELKSSSPYASQITPGMILEWKKVPDL